MPFCKRTVLPRDLCKPGVGVKTSGMFADLADVCAFTLASVLRQLSDLSRHSLGVLEELEGELASVCLRSGELEGRLGRLVEMLRKSPSTHTATVGLEVESVRRGGSSSSDGGNGNHRHNHAGGGRRGSCDHGNGAARFKSPWQQSVNVFGSWSRPECVEELHQQAQLNLQSLLQDFEEQLCDDKPAGQTFRHPPSQSSDDTSLGRRSPVSPGNKRPDFIFLPASKQLYEDETATSVFGLRSLASPSPSPSPSSCESDRPPLGWSARPPVAEKPRWHLGRRTPAQNAAGEGGGAGDKFHGVDLLQHSASPSPSPVAHFHQPRSLEPVTDTPQQNLTLRKIHANLDSTSPADIFVDQPGTMDHSGLVCSNSSNWNGPKGSTFSPGAWTEPYNYIAKKGPAVPPKQHSVIGHTGVGTQEGLMLVSNSTMSDNSGRQRMERRRETEGATADFGRGGAVGAAEAGRGRGMSARSLAAANAFKFRERSLSTPTDSDSFCFTEIGTDQPDGTLTATGNGNVTSAEHQWHHQNFVGLGDNYALLYPRGSSEDSASTTDTISVSASDYGAEARLCLRSRSISLKKSKRKPPPPVRSVSLMKNLGQAEGRIHHEGGLHRDGRPKSLHIPRDHFPDFQPDFLLPSSRSGELGPGGCDGPPNLPEREAEPTLPSPWQLGEWKSSDPYRSLSGSSTATGTTVIECMKVRGSSESLLNSPAASRATSPSHLLTETEVKPVSPFKPPGLMSPSSGYSSQSETPTPTVPLSQAAGGGAAGSSGGSGCKMRPKIPERKSSLPSPKDPAARYRLSFEMPGNAHLELSSIKPKQKASRRHSDTSTATKPGKMSPGSSQVLPVVTQNELKTIRLRSVSRGDLEDCPDGASDTIEEEQQCRDFEDDDASPPATLPKPKPPVAVKPPLPKRPLNLLLKSQSSTPPLALDSPPASPVDRPVPLGNIYKVMRKPKAKKAQSQGLTNPTAIPDCNSMSGAHGAYTQCLFDLPPLPEPQPLLEDPMLEPEFDLQLRPEDGGSLPSPGSNQEALELQDKSKTLPSRMTISSLAELSDKKKLKVPPPVPKKPNVLLLPSSANSGPDRQSTPTDSPPGAPSFGDAFPPDNISISAEMSTQDENHLGADALTESSLHASLLESSQAEPEGKSAATGTGADDKTVLHIVEETDEDFVAGAPPTHTTEDLFTIIHRSKRKVLGRKEPSDSFGSRQSLTSPVKQMNLQRSSSRNENFMALLQKKGSKSSSAGARVSAAELLKSTNPLARRVTELSGDGGEIQGKVGDQ
ncbi:NHS-like protein 2 isoform 1-T1 [Syngnathus typhle]